MNPGSADVTFVRPHRRPLCGSSCVWCNLPHAQLPASNSRGKVLFALFKDSRFGAKWCAKGLAFSVLFPLLLLLAARSARSGIAWLPP